MGKIKTNKELNQLLLANINKALKETGLSTTEVAKKLGIDYSVLWRVLHGQRNIKPEYIAEIAKMTFRTPNEIYGLDK